MRRPPAVLSAGVGGAAALLALTTLGLTWVRRTATGPLGEAGAETLENLPGRDVAPVVAALVPGVAAVVLVGLLLRGRVAVLALVLAALGGSVAGVEAVRVALTGAGDGTRTTAVPWLAALACLLVVVACTLAAVGRARPGPAAATATGLAGAGAAPDAGAAATEPTSAQLWDALDSGEDPTR